MLTGEKSKGDKKVVPVAFPFSRLTYYSIFYKATVLSPSGIFFRTEAGGRAPRPSWVKEIQMAFMFKGFSKGGTFPRGVHPPERKA
ncbi:MAG: hypothetical protein ACLFTV_17695, partial [Desulfococcaceae bacterium]